LLSGCDFRPSLIKSNSLLATLFPKSESLLES
jgi:hypothetical protein